MDKRKLERMTSNLNYLKIRQTLHGYSDGHRLLKTSTNLSKETERIMLIMSDMSGPSMVRGFENYITGYPLKDFYALAKTWYDSRMKRPGCVLTHTLLIENSDLSKIDDLRVLTKLFRHPEINHSILSYELNIDMDIDNLEEYENTNINYNKDLNISSIASSYILKALYDKPEHPIYLLSYNPSQYEDIILRIWSQQWPELRNAFYFCSGSIANRKINNKIFDIQATPFESERQFKREASNGIFIDINDETNPSNFPSWVSEASDDLFSKSHFRNLIWKLGEGNKEGRKAFKKIIEIMSVIKAVKYEKTPISSLTELVSKLFPSPESATSLKKTIYVQPLKEDRYFPIADKYELLKELSTTPYHSAFDHNYLDIKKRAMTYWKSNKWGAKQLTIDLINFDLNPLGEEFIKGIAMSLNTQDIIDFTKERPNLLYLFIRSNPALATSTDLWEYYPNQGREILETVNNSKNITKTQRENIIRTLFNERRYSLAKDIVEVFKEDAVNTILEIYDESLSELLNNIVEEWKNALKIYPDLLLNWLKHYNPKIPTTSFIATLLNPNSVEVLNRGTDLWTPLIKTRKKYDLNNKSWLAAMTFILALGFHNQDKNSVKLVSYSFQFVHDAIEQDLIEYNSWQYLEKHVPLLSWLRNWDKCERLRRALVENFMRFDWPYDEFVISVKRMATFNEIINYCHSTNAGRKFIKKIRSHIAHGEIVVTDDQKQILFNLNM